MGYRAFLSALLLLNASDASAQLISSFAREQVGTLPKGRFLVSIVQVTSSIDRTFGADGIRKPLSSNFDQSVTFQKITAEEPVRGAQLSGLFLSNGLALSDSAGSVQGSLLGTVKAKVPVVGYGLTDDLGIYFSVPILEFRIQAQYSFASSAQTQRFLQGLRADDQGSVAAEFDAALSTSLENKLYKSGYDWDANLHRTFLGDVQVMLMRVYDTGSLSTPEKMVVQPVMVLPTATDQSLRDLYGLKAGDRRFGLGLKYGYQRYLGGRFQFNASASGIGLFPSKQAQRLPKDADDDLREYLDNDARVSGGAKLAAQSQLRYEFPHWVALNVGMTWQRKLAETYSGSAYSAGVYEEASARSGQELLSSYASLDLNSIKSFLAGDFLIPVIAELGVGVPLRGRNAIAEPVVQLQGSLFF